MLFILQLADISMTQDMDSQKCNIIIYDMEHGTKFLLRVSRESSGDWTLGFPLSSLSLPHPLIQASKTSVRDKWLSQSNDLIKKAKAAVANTLQTRARTCEGRREGGRESWRRGGKEGERGREFQPIILCEVCCTLMGSPSLVQPLSLWTWPLVALVWSGEIT